MERGNCWIFAIPRFLDKGGNLVVSWSRRNRYIPHVAWSWDLDEIEEFIPYKPRTGFLGILSSIFFRGYVRKGKLKE